MFAVRTANSVPERTSSARCVAERVSDAFFSRCVWATFFERRNLSQQSDGSLNDGVILRLYFSRVDSRVFQFILAVVVELAFSIYSFLVSEKTRCTKVLPQISVQACRPGIGVGSLLLPHNTEHVMLSPILRGGSKVGGVPDIQRICK